MTPSIAHSKQGFTLVEVVVALSLLSLVLLATVTALRTFANTQNSLGVFAKRVDEIRTVGGFLRDTLQSSVVVTGGGGGLSFGARTKPMSYFRGDEEIMVWKAPVIFGETYGGAVYVRVAREEELLTLRWQEVQGFEEPEDWPEDYVRILADDVEEIELTYRDGFNASWLTDWQLQGSPSHVRMSLKSAGRYWPEMIFEVQR